MLRAPRLAIVLLLALPLAAAAAESSWLPPAVAEGAAQQLAERLSELAPPGAGDTERLARARDLISEMRSEIDGWGEAGVLAQAPAFPDLSLPRSGEPHLDAMGRYQVCNLILFRQLLDPALADDSDARSSAALGLTAMTLATVYLRQPFVAQGGDPAAIEAYLTGDAMSAVFDHLQADPALLAKAQQSCGPLIVELLAGPLERLGIAPADDEAE